MSEAVVYVAAIGFLIAVFPFHIYNYVFVNTQTKYVSVNAGVFAFNFFNANTVENNPSEMQINGKNKKIDAKKLNISLYKIFNQVCVYKVVQLGDYGLGKDGNAYAALAQHAFTTAIYKFIQVNGNYCKLRNFTIFNQSHSHIRYYAKVVTIINLMVLAKIFFIIIMEKINELKN